MRSFARLYHVKPGGQVFSLLRWAVIGCGLYFLSAWLLQHPQPRRFPRDACSHLVELPEGLLQGRGGAASGLVACVTMMVL